MGMTRSIEDITQRLIEGYKPERIVLFGSHGRHEAREDSDIDLLVIKDDEKRPSERQAEVEALLADRAVPLDLLVYTPREFRYLFSIGAPLIEEIMENGRLVYMRKATSSWVKNAEEELDSARVLLEHQKFRASCYHSQQCVEKGLKALIMEKGKRPGRTHDIVDLRNKTTELGWDPGLSMDDAILLNSIYRGRYLTEAGLLPHGEPSQEEAEGAQSAAQAFMRELQKNVERAPH